MPAAGRPQTRREEIVEATREATLRLATERPFTEISVDQIAREAGINRTAFYAHFRGKTDALLVPTHEALGELYAASDRWWHGEGSPQELVRTAITGIVSAYTANACLMRVITEVASYDEEFAALWRELMESFFAGAAEQIRKDQAAGLIRDDLDADASAEALVWMSERTCYFWLARDDRDPQRLIDTLTTLWIGALYLGPP